MDFQWPATLGSPFADAIAVCLRASGAGSALLRPRTSHSLLVFPAVSGTESAQWDSKFIYFSFCKVPAGGMRELWTRSSVCFPSLVLAENPAPCRAA